MLSQWSALSCARFSNARCRRSYRVSGRDRHAERGLCRSAGRRARVDAMSPCRCRFRFRSRGKRRASRSGRVPFRGSRRRHRCGCRSRSYRGCLRRPCRSGHRIARFRHLRRRACRRRRLFPCRGRRRARYLDRYLERGPCRAERRARPRARLPYHFRFRFQGETHGRTWRHNRGPCRPRSRRDLSWTNPCRSLRRSRTRRALRRNRARRP